MNVKTGLEYLKTVTDERGSIIFMKNGSKLLNLVEIKKGYSRGGHFHEFRSIHNLILGKVEYHEFNTKTNEEKTSICESPYVIDVPPYVAHLLTALEDIIFIEIFDTEYSATEFPKFRKIVEDGMKKI